MIVFVDMTCHLGDVVKQRDSLSVFRNPRLQLSFCLTIGYKIVICAVNFVCYARLRPVCILLCVRAWKEAVDGDLWLAGDFDLLLSQNVANSF